MSTVPRLIALFLVAVFADLPVIASIQPMHAIVTRKRAGGGGFSPDDLSGLVLWLKADAVGGGLSDGDPVATWEDSSIAGNDATQADSGEQPTYETGEINGLAVIRFDGSNDNIGGTATSNAARTVFLVAKKRTAAAAQTDTAMSQSDSVGAITFTNTGLVTQWGFYSPATSIGGTASNASVITLNYGSTSSCVPSINGLAGSAFDPDDNYQTGNQYRFGAYDSAGSLPMNVDVAECIIYNVSLSTGDKEDVEDYLGAKWGVSISH